MNPFARSLSVLAAVSALIFALAAGTRSASLALGGLTGLVTSLSALGAAWFAERRKLPIRPVLSLVVVGMLVRFLFVTACVVAAVKLLHLAVLPFLGGLGGIYLVGLGLEVWLLDRAARTQP